MKHVTKVNEGKPTASAVDVTRRRFLGTGSALAVGVLACAAGVACAAQPSPEANISAPDLRTQLAAILDRPNSGFFGADKPRCECMRCRAIRRRGIECGVCGFRGEPVVEACECRDNRASNIAFCERGIAAIRAGHVPERGDFQLVHLESSLAEALASPDRMCQATDDDDVRTLLIARSHQCGHGIAWCPTCGDTGAGECEIEKEQLADVIREVRSVLNSASGGLS